jgi:hypothetical protein
MKTLLALIMIISISHQSIASGESGAEQEIKKPSPHGVKGSCQICHVEIEERLNRWSLFSFGIDKKKLTMDYNALCRQCHGIAFGHGVGKISKLNREDLPMDMDGKIACAITCHDMHINSDDRTQNHYHLRYEKNKLCLSCHNK